MIFKRYIGDKKFYKMVLAVAVPIMLQNGISNFVNLLDNLMIGRLGTNALSGVAIGNQMIFVYYLLMFGATTGIGIFSAQYHGLGDSKGVRDTFRVKLMVNCALSVIAIVFFYCYSRKLIGLFLMGEGDVTDAAQTLRLGMSYLRVVLISLVPIGVSNAYSGTLRDTGQTRIPMLASFAAIFVNLIGNLLLIYGLLGFPALGVIGAAVATVVSRFVELAFLVIYTQRHKQEHPFIIGAYGRFRVPREKVARFVISACPIIANETLWALGQTTMSQCYSYRSLVAMAALNIESTLWMLLNVAFVAIGEAAGIIVGQILGSGDIEKAKDHAAKLRAFTIVCGLAGGIIMMLLSPWFPRMYNTTDEVRSMASKAILIYGIFSIFYAYTHVTYFTLRSGGNTFVTFLFDSCFVWAVDVPAAFIMSRFTQIPVVWMIAIVQSLELIKCIIGGKMVLSGVWARNIVGKKT